MFRQRLVKPHFTFFADNLFQFFRDDQIGREHCELFVHVSRAETEHEIAGCHHVPDVAMQPIEPRLIGHPAMTVLRISSAIVCPLMPGIGGFARRINVGDDDVIGVVESAPNSFRNALVRE